MVEKHINIEGKLLEISHHYLNRKFKSSEIKIKVKRRDYKYVVGEYAGNFYGFLPESFIGKQIHFGQLYQEDKKSLYQIIHPKGSMKHKIESFMENFSEE